MKSLITTLICFLSLQAAGQPTLISVSPLPNATDVAMGGSITLTFSSAIDASTVNNQNILIHGCQTGILPGIFSGGGTTVVTWNPSAEFKPGELVSVSVTDAIESGGLALSNPQVFQFPVMPGPSFPPVSASGDSVSTVVDGVTSITAGDIDGDGDIDVLSGSGLDNKIAWHESSGGANPVFTQHVVSTIGIQVTDVGLADLDGDGSLDLIRASSGDDRLAWFENNGAANPVFSGYVISSTVLGIRGVASGDIDNDGDLDVLSASFDDDKIAWYENDGTATPGFTAHDISLVADGAYAVTTADLDGDGDLDVLSASFNDDRITWYENDGGTNPSFTTITVSNTMDGASDVTTGDLDGDGDLDIIATSADDNKLAWFENNGNANPSFTGHVISTMGTQASGVAVCDLDGDGDLDILRSSISNNTIAWFENDGAVNPTFSGHVVSNTVGGAIDVTAADINGDDRLDILSAGFNDDDIEWFASTLRPRMISSTPAGNATNIAANANITLSFDATIDVSTVNSDNIAVQSSTAAALSGSFSGGGTSTLVFNPANDFTAGDHITVSVTSGLEHNGTALSNPQVLQFTVEAAGHDPQVFSRIPVTSNANSIWDVAIGDLNGDGNPDLIYGNTTSSAIKWYKNDGSPIPVFSDQIIDGVSYSVADLDVADVDQDGDLDVLVASNSAPGMYWYENDGALNPSFVKRAFISSPQASCIRPADLDSDGDLDIVVADRIDDEILWYENNGASDPGFTQRVVDASAPIVLSIDVGDFNGDGSLDIIGAINGSNKVIWYRNSGDINPTFIEMDAAPLNDPTSVASGDMDGDGDLDILAYAQPGERIVWLENDGTDNPSFSINEVSTNATGVSAFFAPLLATDLDGDSHLDILSSSSEDGDFVWYRNSGTANPTFYETHLIATNTLQRAIAVGDLDRDGDQDISTAYPLGDDLLWYRSKSLPEFISVSPPPLTLDVGLNDNFVMTFSDPMDVLVEPSSLDTLNIVLYGSESGWIEGTLSGLESTQITFDPVAPYRPGEILTLSLTTNLNYIGYPLDTPFVATFTTTSGPNSDHEYVEQLMTSQADGPTQIVTGDVNADGLLDFVVSTENDNRITWWRNLGYTYPAFSPHVISSNMIGASSVDVGDMNADGDLDIVATSAGDNKISVFVNTGGNIPAFVEYVISVFGIGATDVCVGDMNGDGEPDMVRASREDDRIAYFEASIDGISFDGYVVSSNADSVLSVDIGDFDGDGDLDIVSASFNDDKIAWYENDGGTTPTFSEHLITSTADGVCDVTVGDIDGDGDLDVVAAIFNDDELAWYESQPGPLGSPQFFKRIISTFGNGTNGVGLADIDADGDLDVFRTSSLDNRVAWFENDGAADPSFNGFLISTSTVEARGIATGDLDGDGDIDVLTSSYAGDEIILLETDYKKETEVRRDGAFVTIEDINGGNSNDRLSLTYDNLDLLVHDPFHTLRGIGFQTEELDSHTVAVNMSGVSGLTIDGANGTDTVTLNFQEPVGGIDFTIDNVSKIADSSVSAITATDGHVSFHAERSIDILGDITSASGNITLQANQQDSQSDGNFTGVTIHDGALVSSQTGDIVIAGRGGNSTTGSLNNFGVSIQGTVSTTGTGLQAGNITIAGTGGLTSILPGYGIYLSMDTTAGTLSVIDGTMSLTGNSSGATEGVYSSGGQLSVSGLGAIHILK